MTAVFGQSKFILLILLTLTLSIAIDGCVKPSLRRFFESCGAAADCDSKLCHAGVCSHSCAISSECGANGTCNDSVCVPQAPKCAADGGCGDVQADTGPDVAVCAEKPCRALPVQCGCAAGQACYLPTGSPVCMTAGSAIEGTMCVNDNDCAAGLVCLTGQTTGNQCVRLCIPGQPAVCASGVCQKSELAGVGACVVACDPIAQTGCGARSCYILNNIVSGWSTVCGKLGGKAKAGSNCVGMADCAPGLTCAGGLCKPICSVTTGQGCAAKCQSGASPMKIGPVEYGACI